MSPLTVDTVWSTNQDIINLHQYNQVQEIARLSLSVYLISLIRSRILVQDHDSYQSLMYALSLNNSDLQIEKSEWRQEFWQVGIGIMWSEQESRHLVYMVTTIVKSACKIIPCTGYLFVWNDDDSWFAGMDSFQKSTPAKLSSARISSNLSGIVTHHL